MHLESSRKVLVSSVLCLSFWLAAGCGTAPPCRELVEAIRGGAPARLDALLSDADPDCSCLTIDGPWMGEGRTWRSTTPLIEAAMSHDRAACLSLLQAGADPNFVPAGETRPPIVFVIRPRWGYDTEIARDLLDHGADPLHPGIRGQPVLHSMIYVGLFPVLRVAVDQMLRDGRWEELAPHLATMADRVNAPSMLYRAAYLYEVSRCGGMLEGERTGRGTVDRLMVSILLDDRAEVEASLQADASLITDRTASGWTPLTWALLCGDEELCQALIRAAASQEGGLAQTTSWGATPLHCAAHSGRAEMVRAVLEASPSLVNAIDGNGVSALCIAVQEGSTDVVAMLLESGADPEIGILRGKTPQESMNN